MANPRTRLRLLLIQVRSHRSSLEQERSCFIERCGVARAAFRFINLVDQPGIRWSDVSDAHAVLIGGAGAHSVTVDHPFTEPLREVVSRVLDERRPLFGSCWGHQFLARMTGGSVISDPEHAEVGTFPVHLTPAGSADPLFADTPTPFWAQLGHNDRVDRLGPVWAVLAGSERCPIQVIRRADAPVYGTQFHPELDDERLRQRLEVYREAYAAEPEAYQAVLRRVRPSIDADRLLARFLELYA